MRHRVLSLSGTLALVLVASVAPAGAQDATTITVDTTDMTVDFGGDQQVGDLPGPDGRVSLREATIASTNTSGPETIAFNIPTSDPGFTGTEFVIAYDPATRDEGLTLGDDNTTLDATTQPGDFAIVVEGGDREDFGLRITSATNSVVGLTVRSYGQGMLVEGASNTIAGSSFSANGVGVLANGRAHVISGNAFTDNRGSGLSVGTGDGVIVADNTVSGNGANGMGVDGSVSVTGNLVTDNAQSGIFVFGGTGTISGNTITGNGGDGVTPFSFANLRETHYTISQNSISENGELGIDLEDFGVTKNDGQDKDQGANDLLNFPEIKTATDTGDETVVEGQLKVPSPSQTTIEFFANDAPDPSGFGEGETFLGTGRADVKGKFRVTLPGGQAGQFITATVTDAAGNTSEFSEAVEVVVPKN